MQKRSICCHFQNEKQFEIGLNGDINKKIHRVISSLGRIAGDQRSSKSKLRPEQEMLAITQDTGIFFSMLLKAIHAQNVLEIGTSSGYSTLWFADALLSDKTRKTRPSIVTVEGNPAKARWAQKNFDRAGITFMTTIIEGEAITALRQLSRANQRFDFAFIDADKENITNYFDLVLPLIRPGGIIAADNMLLPTHFRPQMKRYAAYVRKNSNVQSVTLPIGMGEEITLKLR